MEENSITVIIVNPRNDRLYNYWINGSLEKRCMLKERMREFCLNLCPSKARDINRCIDDILPFVVYVEQGFFQELEEEAPPPIPKATRLFPMRKAIYSGKNVSVEKEKTLAEKQGHKFNIWEKYNIQLDNHKTKESIFKERKL